MVLEQLVGAAGGSGGAPVLPTAREEEVLDSGMCALSVERSVDGRLDTCVPLGRVFAGAAPSELRGARQVSWELEASLLWPPDLLCGTLRGPRLFFG